MGGDLMSRGGKFADLVGVDAGEDRWDGEGRLEVVTLQHREHRCEPLIGAELGLRTLQVGGTNTFRPGRDAEINGDADAAAGTLRPADFVIGEALFVRDRVAFLPRHFARLLGLKRPAPAGGIFRDTTAPPLRSSGTILPAGSSFG